MLEAMVTGQKVAAPATLVREYAGALRPSFHPVDFSTGQLHVRGQVDSIGPE